MAIVLAWIRQFLGVVLLGIALIATPTASQQPTSVNPTANAVKEDQLLNAFKQIQVPHLHPRCARKHA